MALASENVIHLKGGKLIGDTAAGDIAKTFEAFHQSNNPANLAVHFHGGLVPKKDGLETAEHLKPIFEQAGAFPVFFVWESGAIETVCNNLGDIAQEPFFQQIVKRIAQFAAKQLGSLAGPVMRGEVPDESKVTEEQINSQFDAWFDAGSSELLPLDSLAIGNAVDEDENVIALRIEDKVRRDHELHDELNKIIDVATPADQVVTRGGRVANVQASQRTLMTPETIEQLVETDRVGRRSVLTAVKLTTQIAAIVYRVVKRHINHRDHGVFVTIVEEVLRQLYVESIGKTFLWDLLKKDTLDAFGDDANLYGGTAFLSHLAEQLRQGRPVPRITLTGHSTGAVYICHFLEKADVMLPSEVKFDVVFLAPAVNVKTFDHTLTTVGHRIANFRMFTMSDEREIADPLHTKVRLIYPRSILYFVSGLLEDEPDEPLVGMHRFFQGDSAFEGVPDVARVAGWFNQHPGRAVWSVADQGPGQQSLATTHVDFDNEANTMASLQHLLQHGF